MKSSITCLLGFLIFWSCENKPLNEGEEFKPKERHENTIFHFDRITVDGVEYLILERDNNNPHEGFGFMAFRANKLISKQDSILAYLETNRVIQQEIYSKILNVSSEESKRISDSILRENIEAFSEMNELKKSQLVSTRPQISSEVKN